MANIDTCSTRDQLQMYVRQHVGDEPKTPEYHEISVHLGICVVCDGLCDQLYLEHISRRSEPHPISV